MTATAGKFLNARFALLLCLIIAKTVLLLCRVCLRKVNCSESKPSAINSGDLLRLEAKVERMGKRTETK